MRATFRPEFLNRIDDIVVFHPLGMEQIEQIVDIQLAHVREHLAKQRMTLAVTPAAKQMLAMGGLDPVYGARPLKRLIQNKVVDCIARAIIDGTVHEGDQVTIDVDADNSFYIVRRSWSCGNLSSAGGVRLALAHAGLCEAVSAVQLGIARRPRRHRPGRAFVQSAPLVPLSAENGVRCIRVALHSPARNLLAKNVDLWRWFGSLTTVSTLPALGARAKRKKNLRICWVTRISADCLLAFEKSASGESRKSTFLARNMRRGSRGPCAGVRRGVHDSCGSPTPFG